MADCRAEMFKCLFLVCCYMPSTVFPAGNTGETQLYTQKNCHDVLFIKQLHEPELKSFNSNPPGL